MYKYLSCLILIPIILTSCSVDDNKDIGNLPPASFEISVNNISDRSATINWTPSRDPEGQRVHYQIFLDNTQLEEKFTGNSFELQQLAAATGYSGKIVASDGEKETVQNFSFSTNEFSPKIFEGNVILHTQEEVNEFGAQDYNIINGRFDILEPNYTTIITDINDLTPLQSLIKVNGNLRINNSSLESLRGMENLVEVGGDLNIYNNPKLKTLDGLGGLRRIAKTLIIVANPLLANTIPLESAASIEEIYITFNENLETITLLPEAQSVNLIYILANPSLKRIDGFEKIKEVKWLLEINNHRELIKIPAFHELTTVAGDLFLLGNEKLEYIGFPKLEIVGNSLHIHDNNLLNEMQGFQELRSVGRDVEFFLNPILSNFCNLSSLVNEGEVGGQFKITYNLYNPRKEDIQAGNCKL